MLEISSDDVTTSDPLFSSPPASPSPPLHRQQQQQQQQQRILVPNTSTRQQQQQQPQIPAQSSRTSTALPSGAASSLLVGAGSTQAPHSPPRGRNDFISLSDDDDDDSDDVVLIGKNHQQPERSNFQQLLNLSDSDDDGDNEHETSSTVNSTLVGGGGGTAAVGGGKSTSSTSSAAVSQIMQKYGGSVRAATSNNNMNNSSTTTQQEQQQPPQIAIQGSSMNPGVHQPRQSLALTPSPSGNILYNDNSSNRKKSLALTSGGGTTSDQMLDTSGSISFRAASAERPLPAAAAASANQQTGQNQQQQQNSQKLGDGGEMLDLSEEPFTADEEDNTPSRQALNDAAKRKKSIVLTEDDSSRSASGGLSGGAVHSFHLGTSPTTQNQNQQPQQQQLDQDFQLGLGDAKEFNMFSEDFTLSNQLSSPSYAPAASSPTKASASSNSQQQQQQLLQQPTLLRQSESFHLAPSAAQPKTFEQEEQQRKEAEALEAKKRKEAADQEALKKYRQDQENLKQRLVRQFSDLQSTDEPQARLKIQEEFQKSVVDSVHKNSITQSWFADCRQVFFDQKVLKTRKKECEDERENFIKETCLPQWISLFKKHVDENKKTLVQTSEPQERQNNIIKIEEADRLKLKEDFELGKTADATKRKLLQQQAEQRRNLEDKAIQEEREKIIAEYNLATTSLRKRQRTLLHRHERELFERDEEQVGRRKIEQEALDRELSRGIKNIQEVHRQLQVKNRMNLETLFKEKCKREIRDEHKKILNECGAQLQRQRQRELDAIRDKMEPEKRKMIEHEMATQQSKIFDEAALARKLLASDLSFKERAAALSTAATKSQQDLFGEFHKSLFSNNIFGFFYKNRLLIEENSVRQESILLDEMSQRKSQLNVRALETQKLNRTTIIKKESAARKKIIEEDYNQQALQQLTEQHLKLTNASGFARQLIALVNQQEPAARKRIQDAELLTKKSDIFEPATSQKKSIQGKEETIKAENLKTLRNSQQKLEFEEQESRKNIIEQDYQLTFIDKTFKIQFLESKKNAEVISFLRYDEPPRRRDIEVDQSRQLQQVLIPGMNEWHRQHRQDLENFFRREIFEKKMVGEMMKFFDSIRETAKDSKKMVFETKSRSIVSNEEPDSRQAISKDQEEKRDFLVRACVSGKNAIEKSHLQKNETNSRHKITVFEFERRHSHLTNFHELVLDENKKRNLILKIENNVAITMFKKEAVLLKIQAAMHFLMLNSEPEARAAVEKEEDHDFANSILEPHIMRKVLAHSLALEREHRELAEKNIFSKWEQETNSLFSRLQQKWDFTKARLLLIQEEQQMRKQEIHAQEESSIKEIDEEFDEFVRTVMKSIYERRSFEKNAASKMYQVMLQESHSFTAIQITITDTLQLAHRRAIALRMMYVRKLLGYKQISVESDKAFLVLKESERRLNLSYFRGLYVFNLSSKRLENTEKVLRSRIITNFVRDRSEMFFANKFFDLTVGKELKERQEIIRRENQKSFVIISEHIFRTQNFLRMQILNEHNDTGVRTFRNELHILETVGQDFYQEFEMIKRMEAKSFLIFTLPAVQRQEAMHRKQIEVDWKRILWNDFWIRNGFDMLVQNEMANRHVLEKEERTVFYDDVCRPFLIKSENEVRYKIEEFGEAEQRLGIFFAMQKEGIHVWDTLVRQSIEKQWLNYFQIFERMEISRRAPISCEDDVSKIEESSRQDLLHHSQQSQVYVQAVEEKQRMLLREDVLHSNRLDREFSSSYESGYDAIVREESEARHNNIKLVSQHDRFFIAAAAQLNREYKQGLSDLALLARWELTEREEILRKENVLQVQQEEIHQVMQRESRLFLESRFMEHRSELFSEFILNPVIVDALIWQRNAHGNFSVAAEESRQRSLLEANFSLFKLQKHDEPAARRELLEREHELRCRLTNFIFDTMSVGALLDAEVYEQERRERHALFIQFRLRCVELREEYVRRNLLSWEAHSLRTETLIRGVVEFETSVRKDLISSEQQERFSSNNLGAYFERLQLQSEEERIRKYHLLPSRVRELCEIGFDELEQRFIISRAQSVSLVEAHDRKRLKMIEIASSFQANMEVSREFTKELEQQSRFEIQRLELLRRSEQLKIEFADDVLQEFDRVCFTAATSSTTNSINPNDNLSVVSSSFLDEWSSLRSTMDAFYQKRKEEREAREHELYIAGYASKFAASKGLPPKYQELYDRKMFKPSEIALEKFERDHPVEFEEMMKKKKLEEDQNDADCNNNNNLNMMSEQEIKSKKLDEEDAKRERNQTRHRGFGARSLNDDDDDNEKENSATTFRRNTERVTSPIPTLPTSSILKSALSRPGTANNNNSSKIPGTLRFADDDEQQQQQQRRPSTALAKRQLSTSNNQLFFRPSSASTVVVARTIGNNNNQQLQEQQQQNDNNTSNDKRRQSLLARPRSSLLPQNQQPQQQQYRTGSSLLSTSRPGSSSMTKRTAFQQQQPVFADDLYNGNEVDDQEVDEKFARGAATNNIQNKASSSSPPSSASQPSTHVAGGGRLNSASLSTIRSFDEFTFSRPTSACPTFMNPARRATLLQHQQQVLINNSRPPTALTERKQHQLQEEQAQELDRVSLEEAKKKKQENIDEKENEDEHGAERLPSKFNKGHAQIQSSILKGAKILKNFGTSSNNTVGSGTMKQKSVTTTTTKTEKTPTSSSASSARTYFSSGLDTNFDLPGGTGEILIEATRNRLNSSQHHQSRQSLQPQKPATPPPVSRPGSMKTSSMIIDGNGNTNVVVPPPPPLSPSVAEVSSKSSSSSDHQQNHLQVRDRHSKNENDENEFSLDLSSETTVPSAAAAVEELTSSSSFDL